MRIAYVCADPGVPVFGRKGCSIHVQEVLRALTRRGAELELFAARFDGPPPGDLELIPLHPLAAAPKGDLAVRERQSLEANGALAAALRRCRPFDAVYERYSLWSHAGMEHAQAASAPGLLEVNAPLIEEQRACRGLVNEAAAWQTAERCFEAATALLAVSQEVAAYLSAFGVDSERIHVIPNGVAPDRFAGVAPVRPRREETFTIGFVGTLKPWHGLEMLVEVFSLLHRRDPTYRLLLVGDGPMRAALERDLASRGESLVAAVEFAGSVPHDAVPGWLAAMDVATAPYPDLPGFYFSPLKVLEYMAAGLPVVASRIGQLTELIADGLDGLLTAPGDAAALARGIERLRRDRLLRKRLQEAARRSVTQGRTWDHVARRILELASSPAPLGAAPGR
jgi:glycosyltransferase involved in cell wall biosynthesis